jgi:hypothetical protein
LGIDIDTSTCYFFAQAQKLQKLAKQARQILQTCYTKSRWLPIKELQSLAGQAHYPAIPAARFFLRELHSVLGDMWGGRVRLTPQLRRDL